MSLSSNSSLATPGPALRSQRRQLNLLSALGQSLGTVLGHSSSTPDVELGEAYTGGEFSSTAGRKSNFLFHGRTHGDSFDVEDGDYGKGLKNENIAVSFQ